MSLLMLGYKGLNSLLWAVVNLALERAINLYLRK